MVMASPTISLCSGGGGEVRNTFICTRKSANIVGIIILFMGQFQWAQLRGGGTHKCVHDAPVFWLIFDGLNLISNGQTSKKMNNKELLVLCVHDALNESTISTNEEHLANFERKDIDPVHMLRCFSKIFHF